MGELKFFSGKIQEEYYFKIGHECFVSVQSRDGRSCATLLGSIDLKMGKLDTFLQNASKELGTTASQLVFKAIGAVSFLNTIKEITRDIKFSSCKYVERLGSFEILYLPNDSILRVSKVAKEEEEEEKEVKVLIVDDSKTIRSLLTKVLSKSPRIKVVASAEKPSEVEDLIKKFKPDVITLDIHMPEMNGVELLKKIQPRYNIPSIMITSVSIEEGPLVLEALETGAFDYIQKPSMEELAEVGPILIEKVLEASKFKCAKSIGSKSVSRSRNTFNKDCMVVVGSSTGGTTALKDILCGLPESIPPILIVQHIPAVFSKAFADRINGLCPFTVKEAEDGEDVRSNTVYVAPGGKQMKVKAKGGKNIIEINDDPPVNRFKPSVDYMFKSIESLASKHNIIGVILTGMGKDGARGITKLKDLGALTIAQNEESCVVFGMPREAIALGGITEVVHKHQIAEKMVELSYNFKKVQAS